eukprot:11165519-Lingulodinium_polyedra.AAC.1
MPLAPGWAAAQAGPGSGCSPPPRTPHPLLSGRCWRLGCEAGRRACAAQRRGGWRPRGLASTPARAPLFRTE